MEFDFDLPRVAVSAIIASLGLWWFTTILKDVRKLPRLTRLGIYLLIWLAYFILVMMLADKAQASISIDGVFA